MAAWRSVCGVSLSAVLCSCSASFVDFRSCSVPEWEAKHLSLMAAHSVFPRTKGWALASSNEHNETVTTHPCLTLWHRLTVAYKTVFSFEQVYKHTTRQHRWQNNTRTARPVRDHREQALTSLVAVWPLVSCLLFHKSQFMDSNFLVPPTNGHNGLLLCSSSLQTCGKQQQTNQVHWHSQFCCSCCSRWLFFVLASLYLQSL